MIARIAVLMGALAPTVLFAQTLYRCTEGGVITYAERPCGKSAVPVSSLPPAPRAAPAPVTPPPATPPAESQPPVAATSTASQMREEQAQREAKLARMAHERRVRELEYEIRDAERQLDAELDVLRRRQGSAANNLAGATWIGGIAQEMQAVTAKGNARIDALRRELVALRNARQ